MIAIKPSGAYFPMDAEGHVLNPTAHSLIHEAYPPLLDEVVAAYRRHEGDRLLAVYLRGSVARGMATPGLSDVDLVGVLEPSAESGFRRWAQASWAEEVATELGARYPLAGQLDLAVADHDPDFPGCNRIVKFVLHTQGLCLWGTDVTQAWPGFKLNAELAFQHRWLEADWETWRQVWAAKPDSMAKRAFLQSFCKTVIRSGFELVMLELGQYSVDLYCCFDSFRQVHPAQGLWMQEALTSYLNPGSAGDLGWMERLLPWLVEQFRGNA